MTATALKNDTRLTDLNSLIRELGRDSVQSTLAKPKMALALVRAASDGVIGEDDAAISYDQYLQGRRTVISKNSMAQGDDKESSPGSVKANVSKNLQLIKLGMMPTVDGVALLDKVTDLREGLLGGDDKIKPAFDCFLDVARAQLKQPNAELTSEEIEAACTKPEAKDKTIIDKLVEDYKRMVKRHEELPCVALEQAVHAIGDALVEAGGDIPAITKEEKKAEAAMAFLKSVGRIAA